MGLPRSSGSVFSADLFPSSLPQKTVRVQRPAMNSLAIAYLSLRDKKRSLEYFNRALAAYRDRHDRLGRTSALMSNLGATYFSLLHDPFTMAVTTLQDAVTLP